MNHQTQTTALPIRSRLRKLETPASYASRLARQNGLPSVQEFCRDLDLEMQGIADGNKSMLQQLSKLGGLLPNELLRWSVEKMDASQYRVASQLIERRWIVRTALRLCPCCIAETEFPDSEGLVGQAIWHIPFLRQCPQHNVALRSFARIDFAGSVHDFTKRCLQQRWEIYQAAEDAVADKPSRLSRYIEMRAMQDPGKTWLDTLELNAAAYFCELLGLLVERGADFGISSLSERERGQVGDAGFDIAVQGPSAVRAALWALPRPLAKSKAQAHLGSLYQWLSRSAKGKQYEPVKDLVRDYIVESFPIAPDEIVLGKVIEQRRVYHLTSFTRDSGTSMKRARKALIAAGLISREAGEKRRQESEVFCAKAAEPILDKLRNGISRLAALKILNIPRAQFDALTKAGVLKPMSGLGEITPFYARSDVEQLRDQLAEARSNGTVPDDLVDLQTACRKLVCGAAEIVRLIIDQRLDTVCIAEGFEGYLAVRVSVQDVAGKLEGVGVEGFTKAQIRQILSINDPAVKFLEASGYLKTIPSRNPVTRKAAAVVLPEELDRFLADYIPAKSLAAALRTKTKSAIARMKRRGIEPMEMTHFCVGTIYERKLVATELGIDL